MAPDNLDILIRTAETQATIGHNDEAIELIKKIGAKGVPVSRLKDSAPLRPLLGKAGVH
jgi:hypothetical protein